MQGFPRLSDQGLSLLSFLWLLPLLFAANTGAQASDETAHPFGDNVQIRGNLDNARVTFERTGKGSVAFMGGSITEMNGYRPMVCDILKRRFPRTDFTFTNAGISSTCSTTGAFRLESDVLAKGPVDLLFIEFAVNDDQDAHHTRTECIRGMEGISRHARQRFPNIDIIVTYFVNPEMLKTLQSGQVPLTIEAHEAVARHYGVSCINVAKEVAAKITAGTLTWETYGGTHPGPAGNGLCAQMIDALFERAWRTSLPQNTTAKPHRQPRAPLDPLSYAEGRFVDSGKAHIKHGWSLGVPDWNYLPGEKRNRFTSVPMLYSTEPGSEATLEFVGTAIGAYIVAGPDAGIAEASIDGGPFREVDLYHAFSRGLHYPRTVLLGSNLRFGRHTLTLRISGKTSSAGHAMRIMQFGVN